VLQVSKGFGYSWDASKPSGEHVDAASLKLDGKPIDPAKTYRVTINNYLALGGDAFAAFKDGTHARIGDYDSEVLFDYFRKHTPIAPAPPTRITRVN
jgi:5'-nucleotidase